MLRAESDDKTPNLAQPVLTVSTGHDIQTKTAVPNNLRKKLKMVKGILNTEKQELPRPELGRDFTKKPDTMTGNCSGAVDALASPII